MTNSERLKEIEDALNEGLHQDDPHVRWLIARVHHLEEALEAIKQMGTINTELTHVAASIARKALDEISKQA